ncbi:hypothetical protein C5167_044140 [Papaver somniferum]|uniref:Uncharacterized protein n=1 Tax=Papaver somniferum TaxID=3469 RepID=A0A4Y7LBJ2_PAPSO|nr:hypothetical protein C5167_044140 [Papaver somniferum]
MPSNRIAHKLWIESRRPLALHSRIADVFSVEIHPAAKIRKGILFDHATGVVVGETAEGWGNRDRHPKISDGVLIGAGATILGNIKIGEGAKIGAGKLIDLPARTTAVGNPARLVGGKEKPSRHEDVDRKYNECIDKIHTVISAFRAATELDAQSLSLRRTLVVLSITTLQHNLRDKIVNPILINQDCLRRRSVEEDPSLESSFIQNQWALQQLKRKGLTRSQWTGEDPGDSISKNKN